MSTSIEDFFIKMDPECISSNGSVPPFGHETASQVKSMVNEETWNSYFKFTFFRNPEKRFISEYSYNIQYHHTKNSTKLGWFLNDNYELIKRNDMVIDKDILTHTHIFLKYWFKPKGITQQTDWQDEPLDFIGNMDHIKRDWDFIKQQLGINLSLDLPRTNTSNSAKFSLDDDARQLLKILYKEDYDFYNKLN